MEQQFLGFNLNCLAATYTRSLGSEIQHAQGNPESIDPFRKKGLDDSLRMPHTDNAMTNSHSDLMSLLPWLLREKREAEMNSASRSRAVENEELFDLVEGRLSATEREDLLERIADCPESLNALADILEGMALEESAMIQEARKEAVPAITLFDRVRSWFRPEVLIPAISLTLLLLAALPLFQRGDLQPPPGVEVRSVGEDLFPAEPTPTPTSTPAAGGPIQAATSEVDSATQPIQSRGR